MSKVKGCFCVIGGCVSLIFVTILIAIISWLVYLNWDKIVSPIVGFTPDVYSEQIAVNSIKSLAEAQYSHFMYVAKRVGYASNIKELGYVHDENFGKITLLDVWNANIDSQKPIALGKTRSEYLLKIMPISKNGEVLKVGYVAFAIPQKSGYPMFLYIVDGPQESIIDIKLNSMIKITDSSTISKMKSMIKSSSNIDIDEIKKTSAISEVIKDFQLNK